MGEIAWKVGTIEKSPLGFVVKHYFIRAYDGVIGADNLAQGTPAAIIGINNGYCMIGHYDSPTHTNAYAETTTIALFFVKFRHFRQFTLSILTLTSVSDICL